MINTLAKFVIFLFKATNLNLKGCLGTEATAYCQFIESKA